VVGSAHPTFLWAYATAWVVADEARRCGTQYPPLLKGGRGDFFISARIIPLNPPLKKGDLVIRNFKFQKCRAGIARQIRCAGRTLHKVPLPWREGVGGRGA
jgi:hypothetical protein